MGEEDLEKSEQHVHRTQHTTGKEGKSEQRLHWTQHTTGTGWGCEEGREVGGESEQHM